MDGQVTVAAAGPRGAALAVGRARRLAVVLAALATAGGGVIAPAALQAQEPRDSLPAAPVTSCRFPTAVDTSRQAPLVEWPQADSLTQALLAREGYVATRYCADTVAFDPQAGTLRLIGNAAVERAGTTLVGDSILYRDSTRTLFAFAEEGRVVRLRDPSQADDIVAERIQYDIASRTGIVWNVRTSLVSGERWFLRAHRAVPQLADSARGEQTAFFGIRGELTSCNLEEPHYHFEAQQLKMISKNIMVVRPAVLYIRDIPVMWLPFVFQDLRDGRRSGLLTPQLGFSDIVRNSPSYRRQVENLGYYFAISDYMDARAWLDWRSGARGDDTDPGWIRYSGEWNYNWIDRFLRGRIGANHHRLQSGARATGLSWQHSQQFSMNSSLSANVNYSTNTSVRRRTGMLANEVLGTISSQVNYQQRLGPVSLQLGGTRTQYPGRPQVDQSLPSIGLSTGPLNLASWLVWTPNLNISNRQSLNLPPQGVYSYRYFRDETGALDSTVVDRDQRSSSLRFDTPLQIFGFSWRNSFRVDDTEHDYPEPREIINVRDTSDRAVRIFDRTYLTQIHWETGIQLPGISRGRWNISPGISISNVDPSNGFWVRSERTGGEYVRQSKRLQYSLSARPTFYGLWPGIGNFGRFRHAVSPSVSWSYAPEGNVSDAFLAAIGATRPTYTGALAQNRITVGLNHNIEARLRTPGDTAPQTGEKIKLLSMDFSQVSYDFQRAAEIRRRAREAGRPEPGLSAGFATDRFSYSLRSDLLPGFDVRVDYSLFQGSTQTDTARFDPYREGISASLRFDRRTNPMVILSRIFGKAVPPQSPEPEQTMAGEPTDEEFSRQIGAMPLAGQSRQAELMVPQTAGLTANFTFSSQRRRPPSGGEVIEFDPRIQCEILLGNPLQYQLCIDNALANPVLDDTLNQTTTGGPVFRYPPTETLQSSIGTNITPHWAMQWQTTYDFRRRSFASHTVSLQRELHDWRAIFAFTQAPNGNFAFNFFIALKAQPDLKFDYNSRTYRAGQGGAP